MRIFKGIFKMLLNWADQDDAVSGVGGEILFKVLQIVEVAEHDGAVCENLIQILGLIQSCCRFGETWIIIAQPSSP